MFGMGRSTRTTTPPPKDDLSTVLRVLRKHTRILANMHHDGNEGHEELLKKLEVVAEKVDTAIEDVRGYRAEQKRISGRLALVEESLLAAK
jgi:hypothetical protein